MTTAFILAKTKNGKENNALKDLFKINEVKEAYNVYGDYDVLIKAETKDAEELNDLLIRKIKSLAYIVTTKTMVGL